MAPLFFFHKPEPGTGGSYLTKIISTIPLGREAVPLNVSDDKKEFVKELSAAAYEARPILNLNNLSFDLKSPLLSQMISECIVDIRPFGKNTETVRCDCRYMTVIANGNNVRVVGELVRRTLTARLDTKLECPETKPYKADPLAAIQRDRSKYLAAILTIARAYLQSGENQKVKNINGLEQWSRFVQQPLVWLGEADPVKSQADARKRDPDRGALRTRILAVVNHFQGEKRFTAKDVHDKASKFFNGEPVNRDLFDAFSRHDGKGLMDAPSIGTQLSKDEGRVINNFSIHVASDVKGEANQYVIADGESPM